MSRKGGYKIIDLKGLDFSEDMVIKGIHESIEDNYGKPLLFSGIVIDGVEKDDVFANAVVNGDGYDVTLYGKTLHISNVDVVSKKELINIIGLNIDSYTDFRTLKNGTYEFIITSDTSGKVFAIDKPLFVTDKNIISAIVQPRSNDVGELELNEDSYLLVKTDEYYLLTNVVDI